MALVEDSGQSLASADSLKNFNTIQNELSVFEVQDEGPSEERLVVAVIASADRLDNVDYAVFGDEIADEVGIVPRRVQGETQDSGVNGAHLNYVIGTAYRLYQFVDQVGKRGVIKRLLKRRASEIVADAVLEGSIQLDTLEDGVRKEVEPLVNKRTLDAPPND